jgi:hypothetical protein
VHALGGARCKNRDHGEVHKNMRVRLWAGSVETEQGAAHATTPRMSHKYDTSMGKRARAVSGSSKEHA